MKKLIVLGMLMTILSCTARDIELWNEVDREMKERGPERNYYYHWHYGQVCR